MITMCQKEHHIDKACRNNTNTIYITANKYFSFFEKIKEAYLCKHNLFEIGRNYKHGNIKYHSKGGSFIFIDKGRKIVHKS